MSARPLEVMVYNRYQSAGGKDSDVNDEIDLPPALVQVMLDVVLFERLQRGAKSVGEEITLSGIVTSFAAGIVALLGRR